MSISKWLVVKMKTRTYKGNQHCRWKQESTRYILKQNELHDNMKWKEKVRSTVYNMLLSAQHVCLCTYMLLYMQNCPGSIHKEVVNCSSFQRREETGGWEIGEERESLCIICPFLSFKYGLYSSINFFNWKKLAIWLLVLFAGTLLMFLRSDVQNLSPWAKVKVLAGPVLSEISRGRSSSLLFPAFCCHVAVSLWPVHLWSHLRSDPDPPDSLW